MKIIDELKEITNDAAIRAQLSYLPITYEEVIDKCKRAAARGLNGAVFKLDSGLGFLPEIEQKLKDDGFEFDCTIHDFITLIW